MEELIIRKVLNEDLTDIINCNQLIAFETDGLVLQEEGSGSRNAQTYKLNE